MNPALGASGSVLTNPFSFAAPADKERTVVLDMATTAVAGNKIILYRKKNQPIPDGWATDERGKPTNDPHVASLEHLQWFGGYKGFGIAMMVEIMSGCLMNASFGHTELTKGRQRKARWRRDLPVLCSTSPARSVDSSRAYGHTHQRCPLGDGRGRKSHLCSREIGISAWTNASAKAFLDIAVVRRARKARLEAAFTPRHANVAARRTRAIRYEVV